MAIHSKKEKIEDSINSAFLVIGFITLFRAAASVIQNSLGEFDWIDWTLFTISFTYLFLFLGGMFIGFLEW